MSDRVKPQPKVNYVLKISDPTSSDNNYQIPTIWINTLIDKSY